MLRSPILQRRVVAMHERALRALLRTMAPPHHVAIVGGGLFPRTALALRDVLPEAHLTIVDGQRANLDEARAFLETAGVTFVHRRYAGGEALGADLAIFPLAFDGDRQALYAHPPAAAVIVHDWIWRKRGTSRIVSLALLKRVNMVRP